MLKTLPEIVAEIAPTIMLLDAKTAIAQCKQNQGKIIDVREPAEVEQMPVSHSINIPRGVLEVKIAGVCANADDAIYIHCASGGRAVMSAEQLQRMGYSNVTAITCKVSDIALVE